MQIVLLSIYMLDNIFYASVNGLRKKARIFNLLCETLLITACLTITCLELTDKLYKFKQLYLKVLYVILIFRKLSVTYILFQ